MKNLKFNFSRNLVGRKFLIDNSVSKSKVKLYNIEALGYSFKMFLKLIHFFSYFFLSLGKVRKTRKYLKLLTRGKIKRWYFKPPVSRKLKKSVRRKYKRKNTSIIRIYRYIKYIDSHLIPRILLFVNDNSVALDAKKISLYIRQLGLNNLLKVYDKLDNVLISRTLGHKNMDIIKQRSTNYQRSRTKSRNQLLIMSGDLGYDSVKQSFLKGFFLTFFASRDLNFIDDGNYFLQTNFLNLDVLTFMTTYFSRLKQICIELKTLITEGKVIKKSLVTKYTVKYGNHFSKYKVFDNVRKLKSRVKRIRMFIFKQIWCKTYKPKRRKFIPHPNFKIRNVRRKKFRRRKKLRFERKRKIITKTGWKVKRVRRAMYKKKLKKFDFIFNLNKKKSVSFIKPYNTFLIKRFGKFSLSDFFLYFNAINADLFLASMVKRRNFSKRKFYSIKKKIKKNKFWFQKNFFKKEHTKLIKKVHPYDVRQLLDLLLKMQYKDIIKVITLAGKLRFNNIKKVTKILLKKQLKFKSKVGLKILENTIKMPKYQKTKLMQQMKKKVSNFVPKKILKSLFYENEFQNKYRFKRNICLSLFLGNFEIYSRRFKKSQQKIYDKITILKYLLKLPYLNYALFINDLHYYKGDSLKKYLTKVLFLLYFLKNKIIKKMYKRYIHFYFKRFYFLNFKCSRIGFVNKIMAYKAYKLKKRKKNIFYRYLNKKNFSLKKNRKKAKHLHIKKRIKLLKKNSIFIKKKLMIKIKMLAIKKFNIMKKKLNKIKMSRLVKKLKKKRLEEKKLKKKKRFGIIKKHFLKLKKKNFKLKIERMSHVFKRYNKYYYKKFGKLYSRYKKKHFYYKKKRVKEKFQPGVIKITKDKKKGYFYKYNNFFSKYFLKKVYFRKTTKEILKKHKKKTFFGVNWALKWARVGFVQNIKNINHEYTFANFRYQIHCIRIIKKNGIKFAISKCNFRNIKKKFYNKFRNKKTNNYFFRQNNQFQQQKFKYSNKKINNNYKHNRDYFPKKEINFFHSNFNQNYISKDKKQNEIVQKGFDKATFEKNKGNYHKRYSKHNKE